MNYGRLTTDANFPDTARTDCDVRTFVKKGTIVTYRPGCDLLTYDVRVPDTTLRFDTVNTWLVRPITAIEALAGLA